MPCDTRPLKPNETLEQRGRQIDEALARLERFLENKSVTVFIGPKGAPVFRGWNKGDDPVTDNCAFRMLRARSSPALRVAVARAESQQKIKINEREVAAGTHSHDGGGTWHKGH
jgi:hypothetical protein